MDGKRERGRTIGKGREFNGESERGRLMGKGERERPMGKGRERDLNWK